MTKVCIVIIAYNIKDYVARSIESAINQTYKDLEIIIVDDGSTDDTSSICKAYEQEDARIRYYRQKNGGQGSARNRGVSCATGKYLTFLDGDDWLEPNSVECMVQAIEETDADICIGDLYYVLTDGVSETKRYSRLRYRDKQCILRGEDDGKISRMRTFTWGKLYKKQYLDAVGFYQPQISYEDVASVPFVVANASKIVYINKPVYNYLKNRTGSVIHTKSKVYDLIKALKITHEKLVESGLYARDNAELKRLVWGQICSMCHIHKVSWEEAKNSDGYSGLIALTTNLFDDFFCFDEYEITVKNNEKYYKAMKNLVVSEDRLHFVEDDDAEKIIVKKDDKVTEICDIRTNSLASLDEECFIWDLSDAFFLKFEREFDAKKSVIVWDKNESTGSIC